MEIDVGVNVDSVDIAVGVNVDVNAYPPLLACPNAEMICEMIDSSDAWQR